MFRVWTRRCRPLFAVDEERPGEGSRFFAVTRRARDGSFEVRGLPRGDYFIAAADAVRAEDEWHDPDVLNALARTAARITLIEGQELTLVLTGR